MIVKMHIIKDHGNRYLHFRDQQIEPHTALDRYNTLNIMRKVIGAGGKVYRMNTVEHGRHLVAEIDLPAYTGKE
jgi:hypothetical protein